MSALPKPVKGSWRNSRVSWCVRCNADRPLTKIRGRAHCAVCNDRVELPSKMRNRPTRSKHTGRMIHSKKEAAWEPTLLALANCRQITDLRAQEPLYSFAVYSNRPVKALIEATTKIGKACENIERILISADATYLLQLVKDVERSMVRIPGRYRPDWTFRDADGQFHVHDVKGVRTAQYKRNKALMLACFGIEVEEPEPGGVQQRARGAGIHGRGTGSRLKGGA